jgi:hypothetical protein
MSSKFSIWMLCFAYLWCQTTAAITETRPVVVKNVNTQSIANNVNKQQPIILALETDNHIQAWEMYHQLQQAFAANETSSTVFVDIQPRYIVRVHARPSQAMLTKIVCGYKQFTKSANKNIPGVHSSRAENIYIPDYTLSPFAGQENSSLEKRGWPLEWRALWLQFC